MCEVQWECPLDNVEVVPGEGATQKGGDDDDDEAIEVLDDDDLGI